MDLEIINHGDTPVGLSGSDVVIEPKDRKRLYGCSMVGLVPRYSPTWHYIKGAEAAIALMKTRPNVVVYGYYNECWAPIKNVTELDDPLRLGYLDSAGEVWAAVFEEALRTYELFRVKKEEL